MPDKRRLWVSKVYTDSQENRSDTDISWSSSDSNSDHEVEPPVKRPVKTTEFLQRTKSSSWIKIDKTPPKKNLDLLIVKNPQPPRDDFLESPVISAIKHEEESPVLSQLDFSTCKERSPIIRRNKILKKIKRRKREEIKVETTQSESSDSSQSRLIISSPTQQSPSRTQVVISPAKSELSQPCKIDPFPSQHGSEVISDSFSSASDPRLLYHQLPPKRKRYKKCGLAKQLEKALTLQSTSAAIWQHEMFLNKSKGDELEYCNVSEGVIEFFVLKIWKEYGCLNLECNFKNSANSEKLLKNFNGIENCCSFLMISGLQNASNVYFECNKFYKIFPPYSSRLVEYELKQTLCVYNGSRFISV